jgi:hypothetical protein
MADKKISQLTAATTPLAGTEVLPIVQGASTVKVPVNNLFENADSTTTGLLSSTDWSTFNGKVSSQWVTSGANIYYTPGTVNIGATDPSYALDVASENTVAGFGYAMRLRTNAIAGAASIQFTDNPVSAQLGIITCDTSGNLKFSSSGGQVAQFHASKGVSIGNTTDPGAANLSVTSKCIVSGTAITNIGGSSLNHEVYANGNGAIGGYQLGAGGYVYNSYAVNNGGTYYHFYFSDAGTSHGSITSNGTNTTYATSSDNRLKENIVDAKSALPLINSVKIRSFDWIGKEKSQDFGVIAQELIDICPDAVVKGITEEDTWGVDTSFLIPAAIKALQELQIKIEQLETEISTLKGK